MNEAGKLYVVATPIGNLGDITTRALETLGSVDFVASEDTRVTKKLLSHFNIKVDLISYHSNNEESSAEFLINKLLTGQSIALVTDAGTPAISDPGVLIVSIIREEHPEITIVPIPGASAVTTLLSASGLPSSEFTFLGFAPHKKGRETFFKNLENYEHTVVFYESPHRFLKTLESLEKYLPNDRFVVVGRELTKFFEEIKRGSIKEIKEYFTTNQDHIRGEFSLAISGKNFKKSLGKN